MENAQKAIMIGVGLFITIIIIAAVMAITGAGMDLINRSQSKISNISSQMDQQLTASYDGKTLNGSEVLSAIQTYHSNADVPMYILNSKSGTGVWTTPRQLEGTVSMDGDKASTTNANIKDNASQPSYGSFTSVGNGNYVPVTARYDSRLIKADGVTVGVAFFRK